MSPDVQAIFAVGLPSLVALVGILVNVGYFIVINQRLTAVEAKLGSVAEQVPQHKALLDIVLKKLDELDAWRKR
jgi:hypothetical protein